MPARIDTSREVIGPIVPGWNVELDAIPHSPLQPNGSTGVVNFAAPASRNAHLLANTPSTFNYVDSSPQRILLDTLIGSTLDNPGIIATTGYGATGYGQSPYGDPTFIDGSTTSAPIGFGRGKFGRNKFGGGGDAVPVPAPPPTPHPAPPESDVVGKISGRIDSVSLQGASGTFTQSTELTQFASSDMDVPSVMSGSFVAAFDLAYQLAGNQRCTIPLGSAGVGNADANGVYWSLQGHETGFDKANKIAYPRDASRLFAADDKATVYRKWDVRNAYSSTGWVSMADGIYSTGGIGSSVTTEGRKRTMIIGTMRLAGKTGSFVFGTQATPGFGPDSTVAGTGKYFTISLDPAAKLISLAGGYRNGTAWTPMSASASLAALDLTKPLRVVLDIAWPTDTRFQVNAYVTEANNPAAPKVTMAMLPLTVTNETYARPWTHTGNLRGLYQVTGSFSGLDPSQYTGVYETTAPVSYSLASAGIDTSAPIMPFTGTLWDYLVQVGVAKQVDLRIQSGKFVISGMADNAPLAKDWTPLASPQFTIDNSQTAKTVEVTGNYAKWGTKPVLYDGEAASDTFTFPQSATTIFQITTTSLSNVVYNPEPVDWSSPIASDLVPNYRSTTLHPYGAYVITGGDTNNNILPVKPAQFISRGGSVSLKQIGPNTIQMTVTCGDMEDITGDLSMSVTDGSESRTLLRLTGPTGAKVTTRTKTFQTGASYADSNQSPGTITNVAATNDRIVNSLAANAIAEVSGPTLALTASFPTTNLRQWGFADFGMIPGATIVYRNIHWRILTSTIADDAVQITAEPFVRYSSRYFDANWNTFTVEDYITFWEGKTYDDMATMSLAGPDFDWTSGGGKARYSFFPAGELVDGYNPDSDFVNGLDPSLTLVPSIALDPDDVGINPVGVDGEDPIFPTNTTFPDATTFPEQPFDPGTPGFAGVFNYPSAYPSQFAYPGAQEDPAWL